MNRARREGWEGWDDYAPFYDWENARTLGRRDVPFWRTMALHAGGPVLELGCGTGRIALPIARAGASLVGIDRSEAMLARARRRIGRARPAGAVRLVRGDIRHFDLPGFFGPVITGEQRQLKFVVRLRVLPGQREPALPASALRHPSQP